MARNMKAILKITIPDILVVALQKYISSLQVYIPYVRTTLRYSHSSLGSQRYLWISTGSGTKMRLSKQFSIAYYGDQELLINRNCQNQLMFLQGVVQYSSFLHFQNIIYDHMCKHTMSHTYNMSLYQNMK